MQEHNTLKTSYDFYSEEEKLKAIIILKNISQNQFFSTIKTYKEHIQLKKLWKVIKMKIFYLEFGVWKGESINFLSSFLNKGEIYGFDSFKGLREDWLGGYINHSKGKYDLKKNYLILKRM